MKKNLRKTISLLLCLLMLGGVMPLAMLGASAGEGNNTIDPSLRATGNETYTDLIGQTTSAGQHGTVKTPAMLDTEHPGGWLYLYGETYELPVGATLGSDRESRIVPTDGYVLPDRYVIVKIGYASSSGFLTGMPLLWLAHSYDFFDNISATALSGQQIANNAESGASDMSSYGAQLTNSFTGDFVFDYGATLVCGYPPEQENTATYDMLVKTMKADGYSVTFTAKYKTNEYTIIIVDTYSGTDEIVDVLQAFSEYSHSDTPDVKLNQYENRASGRNSVRKLSAYKTLVVLK